MWSLLEIPWNIFKNLEIVGTPSNSFEIFKVHQIFIDQYSQVDYFDFDSNQVRRDV